MYYRKFALCKCPFLRLVPMISTIPVFNLINVTDLIQTSVFIAITTKFSCTEEKRERKLWMSLSPEDISVNTIELQANQCMIFAFVP